jgi:hypothetical protein
MTDFDIDLEDLCHSSMAEITTLPTVDSRVTAKARIDLYFRFCNLYIIKDSVGNLIHIFCFCSLCHDAVNISDCIL